MKTVKSLLKKSSDPYLALLVYRSTPLEIGYSPSELLMSRKLKANVPLVSKQLLPKTLDFNRVRSQDNQLKSRQRKNSDFQHATKDLPSLSPGDTVWVSDRQSHGTVSQEHSNRSYHVDMPDGNFRRNRRNLISTPNVIIDELPPELTSASDQSGNRPEQVNFPLNLPSPRATRSKTEKSAPPERYDPSWK